MRHKSLTITTDGNLYTVTSDDGCVADKLTIDECLGCLASALYRPEHMPQFMLTPEGKKAEDAWYAKMRAERPEDA